MFLSIEKSAKSKEINRLFPFISYEMSFSLFGDAAGRFFQQTSSHRSSISEPEDNDPAFISNRQQQETRKGNGRVQAPVKREMRDMRWTNSCGLLKLSDL